MRQVCVITGASNGIGTMMVRPMAKAGHVVYAGPWASDGNIRPFEELAQAFAKEHSVDLSTIELHVLSKSSISAAIDTMMKAPEGRLDTLIHSAGHMAYGPAEVFTIQQLMHLYSVNCVGTQCIDKIALPDMRKASQGLLGQISSSSVRGPNSDHLESMLNQVMMDLLW